MKFWKRGNSLDRPLIRLTATDVLTLRDFVAGTLIMGMTGSGKSSGPRDTIFRSFIRDGTRSNILISLTTALDSLVSNDWLRHAFCEQSSIFPELCFEGTIIVLDMPVLPHPLNWSVDMDQHNPNHWRQMFDAKRRDSPLGAEQPFGQPDAQPQGRSLGGYDDGFDPRQRQAGAEMPRPPMTPEEITDEAAMALALDAPEYKPWVLQRGRGRPAMMLHLRRYEPKSGLWVGWQIAYPHLVAVEYTGDRMLSLDFGTRQFIVEGSDLQELARHLQNGSVLMVQEFSEVTWATPSNAGFISSITKID